MLSLPLWMPDTVSASIPLPTFTAKPARWAGCGNFSFTSPPWEPHPPVVIPFMYIIDAFVGVIHCTAWSDFVQYGIEQFCLTKPHLTIVILERSEGSARHYPCEACTSSCLSDPSISYHPASPIQPLSPRAQRRICQALSLEVYAFSTRRSPYDAYP